jgi:K+-sensing histidine kinase KdpD
MLLFSGIAKKQQDYVLKEGDLGAVANKTMKNCTDWLVQQGFAVKTDSAPNLSPVGFDAEKVTQALISLTDNAGKHFGATRSLGVQVKSNGNEVILDVRDSGLGIPDAGKEKIFERFCRGRNAESQTRLGLKFFLVDDIMKAHRGRIWVESHIGYGSSFRLIFPASRANAGGEF